MIGSVLRLLDCSRRRFRSAAVLLLLAAATPGAAEAAGPNLVLILADDLGYGEIGAYGAKGIPTPHIDALARSGALFTDAYAPAPQCAPTRAGLMTGRYQQRFGFHNNPPAPSHPTYPSFGLPAGEATLAEALKLQGYRTGLVGKWHLGFRPERHPMSRGFDEFFGFLSGGHGYFGDEPGNPILRGRQAVTERTYLTRAFAREAVSFIDRHAGGPFFLYAAFNTVHLPLEAEPAMLARFAHITDPKRRTFAAMLASFDEAVGAIVAKINARGLSGRTLVALSSDNGCNTAASSCRNAPLRGGKGMLYEGGIRVPFVMAWPGTIPAARVLGQPVTLRDLFPTFLAAASGAGYRDPRLDGVDLLPLARGTTTAAPHGSLFWGSGGQGAVRRGDWKLLEVNSLPPQLYNLRSDRSETKNLAVQNPALVRELRAARVAWGRNLLPPLWPSGG